MEEVAISGVVRACEGFDMGKSGGLLEFEWLLNATEKFAYSSSILEQSRSTELIASTCALRHCFPSAATCNLISD